MFGEAVLAQIALLEAIGTDRRPALSAFFQAVGAKIDVALSAARNAARAVGVAARVATDGTLVAQRIAATMARIQLIRAATCIAVAARDAVPILQLHVSIAGRIGSEQVQDNQEEIADPSLVKRRTNRQSALPFAKILTADMGMSDLFALAGRLRVQSHDAVGRGLMNPLPLEPNLESAQVKTLQLDRRRRGPDLLLVEIAR